MTSYAAVPFRHGLLSISAAAVAWGVGGAVAALLMRTSGLGPVAVSCWRFGVAALCLALLPTGGEARAGRGAVRRGSAGWGPARWGSAVLTGLGLAISQCAYFGSVHYAGLGLGTLITIGAGPVLTGLGAHLLLGERLTGRALGAVALALAGLTLLVAAPAAGPRPLLGAALAVLAGAGQSGLTLWARGGGSARAGTGAFTTGLLCLLPLAAVQGVLPTAGEPAVTGAALLFLGTVPTLLAYRWYFTGLTAVPGTTASVLVLLEPATAAVIGVLFLGEPVTAGLLAGSALLLAAIAALARG
ncbi:DME family drug/metabolite transporter [Streptomyces sp. 1114.5]|uniref:EamA family transporter n=1 Tax=unclassified Streptomyces TaxID=2593676 RepID=UPI000BCB20E1|nr:MULTISPECIES: EamA family transporter [unclassified Streptomyces]RKT12092.1 DME family drug/metabolite transporter [Streptomyces sp. 1114.5]SOB79899.1 drug/metabolite transporter, DME family [Streptomyces sp. 1331.2]